MAGLPCHARVFGMLWYQVGGLLRRFTVTRAVRGAGSPAATVPLRKTAEWVTEDSTLDPAGRV